MEGPSGRPSAAEQQFYRDNCTAFVKNLPFKAEKEELEKFFEDCGGAKEARILRGPDGRTKVRAFLAKPRLAFASPVFTEAVAVHGVAHNKSTLWCRGWPMWTSLTKKHWRRQWQRAVQSFRDALCPSRCRGHRLQTRPPAVAAGGAASAAAVDLPQVTSNSLHTFHFATVSFLGLKPIKGDLHPRHA